ncbi:MAG: hypothetical protein PHC92_04835 [Syntrophomonadaceae bacterium]|nr:hypothetical protein [Syntrophomonadaceae bacterium]
MAALFNQVWEVCPMQRGISLNTKRIWGYHRSDIQFGGGTNEAESY